MSNLFTITGQNDSATVNANFNNLRQQLLQDKQWAVHVLEIAQRSSIQVAYGKFHSGVSGIVGGSSVVVNEGPDYLLIRGVTGKNTRLLFRLQAIDTNTTRVTPEGMIEGILIIIIPLALLMFCVIPVLFTPLAYTARKNSMKRFSASYLNAFCQYLESASLS